MQDAPRATGKTTRILLDAASAMSRGERVLVITYTYDSGRYMMNKLLEVLTVLVPNFVAQHSRDRVTLQNGGEVQFMARGRICPGCSNLRGRTYDSFFSDPGQLTQDELAQIAPCIRSQSVVDIDVTYFETEDEEYEGVLPEYDVSTGSEETQTEPVKEHVRGRRILSSR